MCINKGTFVKTGARVVIWDREGTEMDDFI